MADLVSVKNPAGRGQPALLPGRIEAWSRRYQVRPPRRRIAADERPGTGGLVRPRGAASLAMLRGCGMKTPAISRIDAIGGRSDGSLAIMSLPEANPPAPRSILRSRPARSPNRSTTTVPPAAYSDLQSSGPLEATLGCASRSCPPAVALCATGAASSAPTTDGSGHALAGGRGQPRARAAPRRSGSGPSRRPAA